MIQPRLTRGALLVLLAYCLFIGGVAIAAPRVFYDDFPFLASWVNLLPPYNEHLVTDVGGLYLGFAVVVGLAAWRLERGLVIAACAGFLTASVPHLLYHLFNLDGFSAADGVGQTLALASLLVPPALALWGCREPI